MRLNRRSLLAAMPGLAATPALAQAEVFPARPLRMIVPFAPGGPLDILGRPIAERLSALLGQTVIFENKPGANGIVATQMVAQARPDGYLLLLTTGSFAGNIAFNSQQLTFDPLKDIAPLTLVADGTGMTLVGSTKLPAQNMAELAAYARSKPGGLSCATTGYGNITHLAAEQFKKYVGAELVQVPMHGTAPSVTELLAGNIDLTFSTIPPIQQLVQEGRLRAFGYTGRHRPALLPQVPTMKELGYPDWELIGLLGLFSTGGTPRDRLVKVQEAIHRIVREPAITALLRDAELEGSGMTPEDYAIYLQRELAMQRDVAMRTGMGK